MKKILMILAEEEFRDIEYIVPRAFFEQKGFEVKTVSKTRNSLGKFGYFVCNDFIFEDSDLEEFDALVLVGGAGSLEYENYELAKLLVKNYFERKKLIGAICAAPRNLISWGLLKGIKFTGWNGDNKLEKLSSECGAIYIQENVVSDSNFITANGPDSAEEFAIEIINYLE